jgi:hypothetical protein
LPDDPHRVVDDLLGQLVARRETDEKPRQAPVIAGVQRFQRATVGGSDALQEGRVAHVLAARIRARRCRTISLLCRTHVVFPVLWTDPLVMP